MSAADRVRWSPVGDTGDQPALFGDPATRVRHPEFADMEFIHVRAKRIINEVPAASRVPFRFTINVYRGCSHACVYCAVGETPVLMADGRWKQLAEVRMGDEVYGTVRAGRYRRYVTTTVLDHWSTVKPAHRITLADGTVLIASGDHRFLCRRGWKHVTGTQQGGGRRPHLTTNDAMLGTGMFATPPKDTFDYRRGYLTGMIRGDAHLGSYDYTRADGRPAPVYRFRLALVDSEGLDRTRDYLAGFGIETRTRAFQAASERSARMDCIISQRRRDVEAIREIVAWPDGPSVDWCKGFLAGIFDAEGGPSRGILRVTKLDPTIIATITDCLALLGFNHVVEAPHRNGCRTVRLRGGLRERLRFFHTVDPAITRKRRIPDGTALKSDVDLRVVSVEPLGIDLPMYDITTGTGDFIANGVVSHNCFARPTHEYLDLDAGRDFERVIVVKVNAVERLRAELRSARWGGEHIAMGTNTDPYQRCEGRYQLTRGVLEQLVAARNPFSILTKSSLVLRDTDLLAEANRVTDVAVNFSIGTVDTDVWRSTEPGTPHPRSRLEAIATLRQAGIGAGVLVAPIIPGISDDPAQIDAVVRACVEAGATSITPIVLHLRPGVKEQLLPWLTQEHPELVAKYRVLYPRSYAPRAEQRRIGDVVAEAVARHRGRAASPGQARRLTDATTTRRPKGEGSVTTAPTPEQPSLWS